MATFWFTSAPLPGHLDWGGVLKTAQALQARGHAVTWVSEARIRPLVERAGVPFEAIPHTGWNWPPPPLDPRVGRLPGVDAVALRYRRALDTWLNEETVAPAVQDMRALAERVGPPDVWVTDPFLSAAALAAEAVDVPLAVAGWPAGTPLDEDQMHAFQRDLGREAMGRIERLAALAGVHGENFAGLPAPSVQSPHLHLSYFSPYWHQGELFLPQTVFVGGTAALPHGDPPAWLADIPAGQPLGLVTLGSVFTDDWSFYAAGAQALARNGILPLVVIGTNPVTPEQKAALKAQLPGGTRLLSWIDFAHVFPRLSVILHHGGMGTTHAAILHALPQIIQPHAADQRGQARRARQAKVGLEMSALDVRRGDLIAAVKAVTTTPLVLRSVEALAASFADLGGPAEAADHLEALARGETAARR
ncbi:MAG TPA: glycosyltransferase [Aggregatilinea sp.]|uniref:glycosyltransferase n=1 Tax=Aggregatilinea sp. TaxID=2806333 RepID=UPI002B7CF59B|nr:glycosyltransferase [Aggregatilinea sp.]HML23152.1 glycosyltransferase [Aggregatilinea sp.]